MKFTFTACIAATFLVRGTKASFMEELFQLRPPVQAQNYDVDIYNTCFKCADYEEKCREWASSGECEKSPHFMIENCRKSCHACEGRNGADYVFDMGVPQNLTLQDDEYIDELKAIYDLEDDDDYADELWLRHEFSQEHLQAVARNPKLRHILHECKNQHELCTYWAAVGQCDENEYWMETNCCPACGSAGQLEFLLRCPMDEDEPNAWEPGDLNKFFQDLTTLKKHQKYEPRILSRPSYLPGDTAKTADYKLGPWVVILENFTTEEESNRLIELATAEGFDPSLDGGERRADGTADAVIIEGRTSMNTYCTGECYEDPLAEQVIERIEEITNIPEENSDYLQLLRYEVGQFYHTHHDYHSYQMYSATGVRMLTVFLYLNDVEEGGGTNFPELNITVMPKRGRALIWPSVLNHNPDEIDERTVHQALPVIKGIKYGANAWIHPRGFKGPDSYGCAD